MGALADPKAQTAMAALVAVLYAIGQGTVALPEGVPAHVGEIIRSWDNFLVGIWTIATPILFGISKGPGPWAAGK